MKVSIVTPSYQQADYLEDTIRSVLQQDYSDIEYIIIDGGSTDGSKNIIERYDKQLAYWQSEKDDGQTDAINQGLKRATGDIVAWLNSDDLYLPTTISKVVNCFRSNPDIGIIQGDVQNFSPSGDGGLHKAQQFDAVDICRRVTVHQPGVFWKRELMNEAGYLDPSFYYVMDHDLWLRLFLNYKSMVLPEVLARFRIHDSAKTFGNPKGMYYDIRRTVSRLALRLDNDWVAELKEFELYNNPEGVAYDISHEFTPTELKELRKNSLLNGALEEYTFGSPKLSNAIFQYLTDKYGVEGYAKQVWANRLGISPLLRHFR